MEEPGFRCVRVRWHVVESQPAKKAEGNSEDTVGDGGGKRSDYMVFYLQG